MWLQIMSLLPFFVDGVDWKSILFGAVVGTLVSLLVQEIIKLCKPSGTEFHISLFKRGEEKRFTSVENDGVSFEVSYLGEKLCGEIAVLEIELINDGKKAISFVHHFNRPILIKSEQYTILSAKTVDSSVVGAKIVRDDDGTICVSWDLLKRYESVRLQLIGQRKESIKDKGQRELSPFYQSLKFSVRSDCVDYLDSSDYSTKRLLPFMVFSIVVIACLHIFLLDGPSIKTNSFKINEEIVTGVLAYDENSDVFFCSTSEC